MYLYKEGNRFFKYGELYFGILCSYKMDCKEQYCARILKD